MKGGVLRWTLQTFCRILKHAFICLQYWFELKKSVLLGHIFCLSCCRKAWTDSLLSYTVIENWIAASVSLMLNHHIRSMPSIVHRTYCSCIRLNLLYWLYALHGWMINYLSDALVYIDTPRPRRGCPLFPEGSRIIIIQQVTRSHILIKSFHWFLVLNWRRGIICRVWSCKNFFLD